MAHNVSGKATLSLKDMFPQLTDEQFKALQDKKPLPPSPGWVPTGEPALTGGITRANLVEAKCWPLLPSPPPLVSAVMLFCVPERIRMARRAVNNFMAQTYAARQLVIVNTTDYAVLTDNTSPLLKEVIVPRDERPTSVGAARNLGITLADGSLIVPWDDDDYSHPLRLLVQAAHCTAERACVLTYQVRCHVWHGTSFLLVDPQGIPSTLMYPKSAAAYEEVDLWEDRIFYRDHWSTRATKYENAVYPENCLSLAFYHDHNLLREEEFMQGHVGPQHQGRCSLQPDARTFLKDVMTAAGLQVTIKGVG